MNVRAVRVLYHFEEQVWWAESPDVAGFSAAADSLDDVRQRVRSVLRDLYGDEPFYLREIGGTGAVPNRGLPALQQMPARPEVGNAGTLLTAV